MGQALTKNKKNKNVVNYKSKEEYFVKNGSTLLEIQIGFSHGRNTTGSGELKIFSAKEIESATNYSDPDIIPSCSVSGMCYKRSLDGHEAIWIWVPRQLNDPNPEKANLILTSAAIRMVMNHNNMVKLYGCCLQTNLPILVFEFWPNQSLFKHLHGSLRVNKPLKWVDRLRAATGASYALSYMHTALLNPVVHRALSSHVVVLDDSLHPKLANFFYSVMINPGEKSQIFPVEGTPGYIDPEYIQTQVVTEKCDVYSFGVLMLELLTRRNPIVMVQAGTNLVNEFSLAVERNCMTDMIDPEVMEEASSVEIEQVAWLALKCVASKGAERPTMVEIVSKLWEVQGKYTNLDHSH